MSFYEICGGRPLRGELRVQGAKNSALPILAAALLAPGQSVIRNCPGLSDVTAALEILRLLGCRTVREGDAVLIDASQLTGCGIPDRLMREMRSSVIFLGALLARLEADGCIERAAGEQDRRARRVALTDHGRDQAQETRDHQRAFARETLAVLDGAEKQQLAAIVLKINAALG